MTFVAMCSVASSSLYIVLQMDKDRFVECCKIWPLNIFGFTCSPSLKSNISARVFTESSSAPLVSSSRDSLSSPTMSMSGGSLGCCDNSLKRERISKILFNHLAGLSSSEIGTGVFCWAATAAACLRVQQLIFQRLERFDDSESTDYTRVESIYLDQFITCHVWGSCQGSLGCGPFHQKSLQRGQQENQTLECLICQCECSN